MVVFGEGKKPSQDPRDRPSFDEIVGQEAFKQALLVVAANPDIDGVLVRGEKGTAKSTAVRGLQALLPEQQAVADCPYGCPPAEPARQCADCRSRDEPPVTTRPVPLVTLPLGATRDRVVGTLSVDSALDGQSEFEPGLLARANRGILYVDEVNLLDDHLVDVLLDAAASGVNRVERDGVSVSHPASFTLVGTMNPEEGELRPQLRDRFALQASVTGCAAIDDRVAIIEQALDDPDDPPSENRSEARLRRARESLDSVELPAALLREIAELCRDAGVDGHRGDIATARAARTLAALDGRDTVIESDIQRAAQLALPHRFQSRPFEDAPDPQETIEDHFEDDEPGDPPGGGEDGGAGEGDPPGGDGGETPGDPDTEGSPDSEQEGETSGSDDEPNERPTGRDTDAGDRADAETAEDATEDDAERATPLVPGQERVGVGEATAPDLSVPDALDTTAGSGTRSQAAPNVDTDGPRLRTTRADSTDTVDPAASVRATAQRGGDTVTTRDLRQSVRQSTDAALVLFVVDASASMRPAMRTAKATVLELLEDAYQHRDEVGFIAVAGESADVVLPPTDSVTRAARHLKDLPTGDRTPLPDGLRTACQVIDRADPAACVVVVVTDGRANVADASPTEQTRAGGTALADRNTEVVVVETGDDSRAGVTDILCEATDADRIPLDALAADHLDESFET